MLQVYDRVLRSNSLETLLFLTLFTLIGVTLFCYFESWRSRELAKTGAYIFDRYCNEVNQRSLAIKPLNTFSRVPGRVELSSVQSFLSGPGFLALIDLPFAPLFFLVIWVIHPAMLGLCLAGAMLLLVIAAYSEKSAASAVRKQSDTRHALEQKSQTFENGADFIVASGLVKKFSDSYQYSARQHLKANLNVLSKNALARGFSRLVRLILQISIIGLGAVLVIRGEMTPGALIASSIISARALAPVDQIIGAWSELSNVRQAIGALSKFSTINTGYQRERLEITEHELSVSNLSFRYPRSAHPTFANLSFSLSRGQILGLCGQSGTGKTTLCQVILGMREATGGRIFLGTTPINEINRAQFGEIVGYLPQSSTLFDGTLAENISSFSSSIDRARVIDVCKIVGIFSYISSLKEEYDTLIGRKGIMLSGGQRKLVCLARAIYHQPKLLVLDEPSASLDQASRETLVDAILTLAKNDTSIILVTHNQTMRDICDLSLTMMSDRARLEPMNPIVSSATNVSQLSTETAHTYE